MKKSIALTAALATVATLGLSSTAAVAAKTGDVSGTTACTAGVKAKLKAGVRNGVTDNALIKVQIDVDDRVAGDWAASANGSAMTLVSAPTAGNGFVSQFVVFLPNGAGADAISVSASTAGRSCSGNVTVA